MGRPTKNAARMRKRRSDESPDSRNRRLDTNKKRIVEVRHEETENQRDVRLAELREYTNWRLSKEKACDKQVRLDLIRERLSNETIEERSHRLSVIRKRLSQETEEERAHRLSLISKRLSQETREQRAHRLSLINKRLSQETHEQRAHRLSLISKHLSQETHEQRTHRLSLISKRLSQETHEQRAHRLSLINKRLSQETHEQRLQRLSACRTRSCEKVQNETADQRNLRLQNMRQNSHNRVHNFNEHDFTSAINVFADVECSICKKTLYPKQRCKMSTQKYHSLLPATLLQSENIITCSRCSCTLRKYKVPSKAFWNNMEVSPVPPELTDLSEVEKRLLCRIVPFMNIIKVHNRFSSDWCKGQVILFAQDIVELAEQLPLNLSQCGIFIVAESLENVKRSRQFQVDISKLKLALQWLLANNALYKDVRSHFSNVIDILEVTRAADEPPFSGEQHFVQPNLQQPNTFKTINDTTTILRGSFHQGDDRFDLQSRGKQCTAMATAACVAFCLLDPELWTVSDLDYILILGDKYYRDCIAARTQPDIAEMNTDFLAVTELLPEIIYRNRKVHIVVGHENSFNGHIDNDNSHEGFPNLKSSLHTFFLHNTCAILTANSISVAMYCRKDSDIHTYWLFDSHSRGPKGCKASSRGACCCMRFNNIDDLYNILRRNFYCKSGNSLIQNIYSLTPLIITENIQTQLQEHILSLSCQPSEVTLINAGNTDILEVQHAADELHVSSEPHCVRSNILKTNTYKIINNNTAILQGSFHQGNDRFDLQSRGKQCTGIATAACVAFCLLDPNIWTVNDVDYILIVGDKYYQDCIAARRQPDVAEMNTDYLAVTELLPEMLFKNHKVHIAVSYENSLNGHIDNDNSQEGFPNLKNSLYTFFDQNICGILTANSTSVAVYYMNESGITTFWLFDSHSRGPKGCKASSRGTCCCMRFNNIDDLYNILRRNLYCKSGNTLIQNIYSLTPLIITENTETQLQEQELSPPCQPSGVTHINAENSGNNQLNQHREQCKLGLHNIDTQTNIIFTTSSLRPVDENMPDINNIVHIAHQDSSNDEIKLVDIKRKTAPPLHLDRERRIEELAWFYLFPDGKNGFGEERNISITPLDYFQARVMSNDRRFQRADYLFFALSVVEYYRAKSSVSVSCRMRQGERTPQNIVDNMHLTMRNIRGSASYWRRCCSELIAMIRSLGPPTWFVTFSCNDLNWLDMLQALLIADGNNYTKSETLEFSQRLELVQKFPVIVARQFTLRVNAMVHFLKNNPHCLGGEVEDFWYRIEFQNRGSPHLHMLVWCKNVPDFMTQAGLDIIETVVSCSLNTSDIHLNHIVKAVQIHKHTNTCYKDRENRQCRFGFPRPVQENTVCLGPDETLANNGRFCLLKRTIDEVMVNNYNPILLKLWQGNMDIQPCGSVSAVAYYVAKYASKCEPQDSGEVIKDAILKAKSHGGSVWKQLFSVSMAILSQRLVSSTECAYRLCHLPLKMSSRKAVFVNSCKPDQRFMILRFAGDETSVLNNIFDRYVQRPDNLEDLSLAEFAVRYETVSGATWTEEDEDIDAIESLDHETNKYITLKNNTRMRIRNKPAVLRTRYYTINSDKEGYYYNFIVCHIPFRNERELMLENESAEACFLRRQNELRPLLGHLTTEQFAHAEQIIQVALAQAVAMNAVNETENENAETLALGNHSNLQNDMTHPIEIHADEQLLNEAEDYCGIHEEIPLVPDEMFLNAIQSLNFQQKDIFKKITSVIQKRLNNEDEQMLLFITGGAGSGKSFLLKILVQHIRRCYGPTVDTLMKPTFVEVASLTGVAARQIFGKTLHMIFSLPIEKHTTMSYRRMTGQRLERERQKWRYIQWLIIDEISMVSYENLRVIHLRLQEFKNNDKLFGGVNILVFGDIMQLPPVKGHWCFMQPPWCTAELNLWHQFSFCELTINMRQKNDIEFIDLLNNLRFGELTTDQLQLLYERTRVPLTGDFEDGAAVRIFPTVKLVDDYNHKMTDIISNSRTIYTITSIDESREAATYGKKPPHDVIPSDANSCGGLLHSLKLATGSRVMLRRNISISDGLVNGVMGIIKSIKWPALRRDQLEQGELPDAVLVQFDDPSVGSRIKDSDGYVAITPVSATFQAKKGYGDVERRMLPLILSWAVTVHKLQDTTLEKAVIDLGHKIFAKGQVYVALSRVKTLDGLVISDLDSKKLLNKPHDDKCLNEMQRLRNLTRQNDIPSSESHN